MKWDSILMRKLLRFALPAAIQQLTSAVVRVADTFMLGMVDQTSMAAVSLACEIQNVHSYIAGALMVVTGVFAAQYMGRQDREAVERIFAIGARIAGMASMGFVFCALFLPEWLMRLLTNDGVLIKYGAEYLRNSCPLYFFYGISWIYHSIMRNCGRAIQSAVISSVSITLKLLLNGVFIFGWFGLPELGITGVALASAVYSGIEMLAVIADSVPKGRVKLHGAYLFCISGKTPGGARMRELQTAFCKYLVPILGEMVSWGIGYTVCMAIIGRLGEDVVAVNSLANTVKTMVCSLYMGFKTAGGTILGFELGAGNLNRAREYGNKLVRISMSFGVLAAVVYLVSQRLVIAIVDMTPAAVAYLPWMFAFCALSMIGQSGNAIINGGILSTGGDAKFSLLSTTLCMWCGIVPFGILAAFVCKAPAMLVCFIIYAEELIRLPFVIKRYRKYKWVRNMTEKGSSIK